MQLNYTGRTQYLSHLQAGRNDALFTTYAASPGRSHYRTDQGYQFQWTDTESGVEFISREGPNLGIALQMAGKSRFRLGELYREPVVTISYSDLVKYYYYPFPYLRAEVFFTVYSSETAILQYRLVNEGHFPQTIMALPYLYYPSADSIDNIDHVDHVDFPDGYTFPLKKQRDGWMVEHNIPVCEQYSGFYTSNIRFDSVLTFSLRTAERNKPGRKDLLSILKKSIIEQKRSVHFVNGIVGSRTFRLQAGEATDFRILVCLSDAGNRMQDSGYKILDKEKRIQDSGYRMQDKEKRILDAGCWMLDKIDLEKLVREDEKAYSRIPGLKFTDRDKEMLYWSAFSLMRQCMMPPEGECGYNYYVFSREPRWGWGYGGQVFHESLTMMAYTYMDPVGAMNSQQIFMERQHKDGYINYRTGPYLDETIETDGKPTSSAPWFNYENLEIYKITGDRKFLREAYHSGKKFYQYYISNRDSNQNGLCEWGAHAELESVRDARVAVWDKVGWAANFEGLDVNSMLVMEAKSLAEMAKILGNQAESKQWVQDADHRTRLINEKLWDPVTSFYYNVNKKDQTFTFHQPGDLKIKEIIGFLPLWAGIADRNKAALLVEKIQDTSEFWRLYGVPSLTAKSDYYCPIGYWNGPVWVQWEYLLYRGLKDYGYHKVAADLANRVLDNMIYHLKKDHVFWEFYSADDHQAGWNKTYLWAGIAVRFFLDAVNLKPE
jgi:hypothetical protein